MPKAYGGAGVSFARLVEVIAIISSPDSSLGQLPQNHFAALDAIRVTGSDEQKRLWFDRVLQGYRLDNAFSEAKSRHVGAFETTLRREVDDYVVNGEKHGRAFRPLHPYRREHRYLRPILHIILITVSAERKYVLARDGT